MTPLSPTSALLTKIASDAVINQAYLWVCKQRLGYPPNADIWHLRTHWQRAKTGLITELLCGAYRFAPQQCIRLASGKHIHLWGARDALVLKAMAIVIGPQLPLSPRCTHVKGHGGLKGALRYSLRCYGAHRFVCRTDVKGYYANIDQAVLLNQLERCFPERDVRRLLVQTIRRVVQDKGHWLFI